jgi:peptide/nickel transport system permease protein
MGIVDGKKLRENYVFRNFYNGFRLIKQEKIALICLIYLLVLVATAVIGPSITSYEYDRNLVTEDGSILRGESPSLAHPFGTNDVGQDVFSRVIHGARATVITGAVGGFLIMTVGTLMGVVSGYVGGRTDDVLMRFTDIVYGVPVIPIALVLFALFELGFFGSIVMIGLILWRGAARVIRSQTLQIRERPFVLSAKATGASTPRIIVKHILPNVAPMAVLYLALGVGWSIIIQAGLAFIGVTDPFVPSWGIIVRNAYKSGQMASLWWWSLPPGILISLTVVSTFMIGRSLEQNLQDQGGQAIMAEE